MSIKKEVHDYYKKSLSGISGITILSSSESTKLNYTYFPNFTEDRKFGISRDQLYNHLKENNIFGRRYFYPLISEFSMHRGLDSAYPDPLTTAHRIAEQVIRLPIYSALENEKIMIISEQIRNFRRKNQATYDQE